jgi:hypothetical protein
VLHHATAHTNCAAISIAAADTAAQATMSLAA